jgi:hypothetical protein
MTANASLFFSNNRLLKPANKKQDKKKQWVSNRHVGRRPRAEVSCSGLITHKRLKKRNSGPRP